MPDMAPMQAMMPPPTAMPGQGNLGMAAAPSRNLGLQARQSGIISYIVKVLLEGAKLDPTSEEGLAMIGVLKPLSKFAGGGSPDLAMAEKKAIESRPPSAPGAPDVRQLLARLGAGGGGGAAPAAPAPPPMGGAG